MKDDLLRLPPQSLESEKALLGSVLIEKDALVNTRERVSAPDFYADAHRAIFQVIEKLSDDDGAVDIVTVGAELKRRKKLGEVGGMQYLKELVNSVSTAAHAADYAKTVRAKAVLRELIRAGTKLVRESYDEKDSEELLERTQGELQAISTRQGRDDYYAASELADEVVEQVQALRKNRGAIRGVATGFVDFDRKTAGLQKGDLILLAARPSVGKTAMMLNICAHVALQTGKAVAIYSLEMDRHSLMTRLIASEALCDLHEMRNGFFRREKWSDITTAAARLQRSDLYFVDSPSMRVADIRASVRHLVSNLRKENKELALVVIDYLQLIRGSSRRMENRQQEVSEISRSLKAIAREQNLPLVALSQLSRRTEEKGRTDARPQLSDLRESGALEQDADLVAFIFREGLYQPKISHLENKAELIIGKQRNGPIGTVELSYRGRFARFDNKAAGDEEPPEESAEEPPESML
ncbi:MAG: replicative DNA helicase [Elusimicrobiota bacterium]